MGWVLATVVLNATAQITLKAAAVQVKTIADVVPIWWQFAIALGAYGISVVTWVLALRDLPLSLAYPFMALAFLIVPIASLLLFKESLTMPQWAFLALLVISVIGFALTAAPTPPNGVLE